MKINIDPKNKEKNMQDYENPADQTPGREGGDNSLAESFPQDSRADEKVIVNEQRENKIVNAPSQTAAHVSKGNDEDIVNDAG